MSEFDISTYRRKSRRTEWGLWPAGSPQRDGEETLRDALLVCTGLALLFGVMMWMQARDLEAQLEEQKVSTKKYSRMLADCLNGGGLYDKAHNQALFCDRAITMRF